MKKGKSTALIFVADAKGGTVNYFRDTKCLSNGLNEMGFTRPQIPGQTKNCFVFNGVRNCPTKSISSSQIGQAQRMNIFRHI